jgi:hypothetical protein
VKWQSTLNAQENERKEAKYGSRVKKSGYFLTSLSFSLILGEKELWVKLCPGSQRPVRPVFYIQHQFRKFRPFPG